MVLHIILAHCDCIEMIGTKGFFKNLDSLIKKRFDFAPLPLRLGKATYGVGVFVFRPPN